MNLISALQEKSTHVDVTWFTLLSLKGKDGPNRSHGQTEHANGRRRDCFFRAFRLRFQKHDNRINKNERRAKRGPTNRRHQTEIGQNTGHEGDDGQHCQCDLVDQGIVAFELWHLKEVENAVAAAHENQRIGKCDGNGHGDAREACHHVRIAVVVENETIRSAT